ncbi:hypothetical protein [Bryobacter aggregatus]|uniref:glycan biosynthesis hexose transferase WsfD n=1 Tax=Bryobacter aggregatus TaxID=360054 RepID=UPI00068FB3B1|nr:hypothetical protein [Bryobacter aggregatus]
MSKRSKFLWLLLFLCPIVWQLWVPPYTGLADNGDFAKVVGRYSLAPTAPGPQQTFYYFNRIWEVSPAAFWLSPYWGVEVWLTRFAIWIGGTAPFDMRWLGLLHTAIFSVAAWFFLSQRAIPNLFAIVAFTDAAYVTYFQSFYFDAASLIFLLVFFASWIAGQPVALALGAVGFSLSKGPHAPVAVLLGLILLAQGRRSFLPAALALLVGGGYLLSQTRDEYKATAYYNLAFFKLGVVDPSSLEDLKVAPANRRWIGTHAFMPESPAQSEVWLRSFFPAGGYGNAAKYYLTHPWTAVKILYADLATEAPQIRAQNLGNYEPSTGKAYGSRSKSFGWYSEAKSWFFTAAPWHLFLLVPTAAWLVWRVAALRWPLAGVLLVGSYEFAVASLADACETYRHLLLFHVSYDLLLFLALTAWLVTQSKRPSSL